jgi:hypothetical protein
MKNIERRRFLKSTSLATAAFFSNIGSSEAKQLDHDVVDEKSQITENASNNLDGFHITYEGEANVLVTDFTKRLHTIFITCKKEVATGTKFRLVAGGYRFLDPATVGLLGSAWQLKACTTKGEGTITVTQTLPDGFHARMKTKLAGDRSGEFAILVFKVDKTLQKDDVISIQLEGRPNGIGVNAPLIGSMQMEMTANSDADYKPIGRSFIIKLIQGQPSQIEIRAKANPNAAGNFSASIFMTDKFGNPSPLSNGKILLEASGKVANLPKELYWQNFPNGLIELHGLKVKAKEAVRIKVKDQTTGAEMLSQAILPSALKGNNHYYGEIHFHTDLSSDAEKPLSEAYKYARNYLQLDVLAATEHSSTSQYWNKLQRMFDYNHEEGVFVTLPCWEQSFSDKGHINIYAKTSNADFAWSDTTKDWNNIASLNEPQDVVIGPHVTMSAGHPPFDWKTAGKRMRFVEMLQIRGCSESNVEDKKWGINPDPKKLDGSVRTALAMGYRVGFVAGTDNHSGQPTRHHREKGYAGLTGFIAPSLTRENIWNALNERHTYATSGVPIVCHFGINGAIMGSEISIKPTDTLILKADLYGTAVIELVEIISENKIIRSFSPNSMNCQLTETLPVPQTTAYFYIRLLQKDGHRAWASPVWVDVKQGI